GLGLDPWDVFHEGLTHHVPLTFGQVVIAVGVLVLLLWIPLRQRPGIGTVLNVILIGLAADAGIALVSAPEDLWARALLLGAGIVGNGLAGALYISAKLGTGPRDGLWVALVARTGISVRAMRTGIEVLVLVSGFLLGGTVGVGTVVYALAIGPLVQFFLEVLQKEEHHVPARLLRRAARADRGRAVHVLQGHPAEPDDGPAGRPVPAAPVPVTAGR
ncbi:MAG TPA: hypothetical protein VMZ66_14310, partial [Aeromicrobium sp.]|nr:hypothetical protein [Aeromicrobium sp.]